MTELDEEQAIEVELQDILFSLETQKPFGETRQLCHPCRRILSVGPSPILAGQSWPSPDAPIQFC